MCLCVCVLRCGGGRKWAGPTCLMCMVSWCCVSQFLSHSGQMKAELSSLVSYGEGGNVAVHDGKEEQEGRGRGLVYLVAPGVAAGRGSHGS